MSDELVERVARALYGDHRNQHGWPNDIHTWDEFFRLASRGHMKDYWLSLARAALSAIPAAEERSAEWQDISTAPKDGSYVLGFGPHETRGTYQDVIHYWSDRWTITWMEGYGEPTHWMPLPAPPAHMEQADVGKMVSGDAADERRAIVEWLRSEAEEKDDYEAMRNLHGQATKLTMLLQDRAENLARFYRKAADAIERGAHREQADG